MEANSAGVEVRALHCDCRQATKPSQSNVVLCRRFSNKAEHGVAKEPYLPSQGLLKKVEWRENRLQIVYTHNASESIPPDKARLSQ
jgi:hypothetical protein